MGQCLSINPYLSQWWYNGPSTKSLLDNTSQTSGNSECLFSYGFLIDENICEHKIVLPK